VNCIRSPDNARTLGEIRRGQLITTYGVGAIVAVQDESYMIAGLIDGRYNSRTYTSRALRENWASRASYGRRPLCWARHTGRSLPTMVSCRVCSRLARHSTLPRGFDNECRDCGEPLIRRALFSLVRLGNVDDFIFMSGCIGNRRATPAVRHNLTLETSGASSSLRDVV
jgi:hypothetical protein